MPRSCSIFIQSDLARRASPRALTRPAAWIAPPSSRRCSVKVVLPASGWEMIAKVRRLAASLAGVRLISAGVSSPRPLRQGEVGLPLYYWLIDKSTALAILDFHNPQIGVEFHLLVAPF